MASFDPDDHNIPDKLRKRIEHWAINPPKLQFSQYGPINKYLNLKFPDDMVKPQGLLRSSAVGIEQIEEDLEQGNELPANVSIDSTGIYVIKDEKFYPDFIVVRYHPPDEDGRFPADEIRLVVEVGSLREDVEPKESAKKKIQAQLIEYMGLLGKEGGRWHKRASGVAILGTMVWYLRSRRTADGGVRWIRSSKWSSLYDDEWVQEMKRVKRA